MSFRFDINVKLIKPDTTDYINLFVILSIKASDSNSFIMLLAETSFFLPAIIKLSLTNTDTNFTDLNSNVTSDAARHVYFLQRYTLDCSLLHIFLRFSLNTLSTRKKKTRTFKKGENSHIITERHFLLLLTRKFSCFLPSSCGNRRSFPFP